MVFYDYAGRVSLTITMYFRHLVVQNINAKSELKTRYPCSSSSNPPCWFCLASLMGTLGAGRPTAVSKMWVVRGGTAAIVG